MLVFHHIPKTAGTSFLEVLRRNYPDQQLFEAYDDILDAPSWWRRWYDSLRGPARERIKCVASHSAHFLIRTLEEAGAPFQALTFLRDPVERCISLYHFVIELARGGAGQYGGEMGRILLDRNWSLEDIYRGGGAEFPLLAGFFNGQTRAILRPSGGRLRYSPEPAQSHEEAQLTRALARYDVGFTEDYNQTIDRWAERFSWRYRSYDTKNVTQSRKQAPPPSRETLELIRSFNQVDGKFHGLLRTAVQQQRREHQ
jgi:hypothetical protein